MAQDTSTLTDAASKTLLALEPTFLWAAATMKDLPPMGPVEVAFAGRSNVGKSSLVNGLLNRNGLARASGEPGRTRELIFFAMKDAAGADAFRIVDLPGYGYAKAPKTEIARWTAATRDFLRGRSTLKRVFVLIDSRHGVKDTDLEVMTGLDKAAVNYQVVLTKTDKLKAGELDKAVAHTLAALAKRPAAHPMVLSVSSREGTGLADLRAEIVELVGL
jgi:GTP-binding protein